MDKKKLISIQISEGKKEKNLTIGDMKDFFLMEEFSSKSLNTDSFLRIEWRSGESSWSDKLTNMLHTPYLILER